MRIALTILFLASTGSAALAQTPGPNTIDTTLIPGTTVWVTDSSGHEEKMRIVAVSNDSMTANTSDGVRRLRMSEINRVRVRQSDSLVNGALIGAGAAVASGLFFCRLMEPWDVCLNNNVGPMLRTGALGAGIGIAIDALIRGRRTIYEAGPGSMRLEAAPIIARRAGGLQVSISF
jgi:hypothetical protein